jgi:entericidin B
MKRLIAMTALFVMAGITLGCNTMAGAGTDISHGGQALHNEAEKAK